MHTKKSLQNSKKVSSTLLYIFLIITLLLSLLFLPVFIITVFTPFYYIHIPLYNLTEVGYTSSEIISSYNHLILYLIGFTNKFHLGVFNYSSSGMLHFQDVAIILEVWFAIGFVALFIFLVLLCLIVYKVIKTKVNFKLIWVITGSIFLTLLSVIGIGASINFDATFTLFHKVFFPGKDNWYFNEYTDEIIKVLPAEFFRNSLIFIIAFDAIIIILFIIVYVLKDRYARRNQNHQKTKK